MKMRSPTTLGRQHFQDMASGIPEVKGAAAVPAIDLAVLEGKGAAAIGDALPVNAGKDRVEVSLADLERVVMALEALLGGEVEGECLVQAHLREMPAAALIMKTENAREEACA